MVAGEEGAEDAPRAEGEGEEKEDGCVGAGGVKNGSGEFDDELG